MDIHSLLEANNNILIQCYKENLELTLALQATLIEDVLPHVQDELQLDIHTVNCAREWLEDTSAIFQILRRHKFTRSFALESIRQTLVWRVHNIRDNVTEPILPLLYCLPSYVSDPLEHPIIVLKLAAFGAQHGSDDFKRLLMLTINKLQVHLKQLNGRSDRTGRPILQYIVLLDLADVSIQSLDVSLLTWSVRDAIPRFPGMIAAVFALNYSWTHSGIWTIIKRVLPAPALSRIFFPSTKELEEFFTTSCLPKEYGGTLPSLQDLDDPLRPNKNLISNGSALPSNPPSISTIPPPTSQAYVRMSPTSLQNPFFGYPILSHPSSKVAPSFQAGRRRLRDLLLTLARLWWKRWKKPVSLLMWLLLALGGARIWIRRGGSGMKGGVGTGLVRWAAS